MDDDESVEGVATTDRSPPGPEKGMVTRIFGSFNKTFWVVNAFELFERGAYYSTMAVLGYHVVLNLGIARDLWGALYSGLIILLYFVPLFAAALADRFGYKKILIVAFSLMFIGYTSLTFVEPGQVRFLIASFFMVGMGAGLFKPIISASIAHVTPEKQRNLAYSIYYWMINLGAMIFPLAIGFLFPDEGLYNYVFLISTGLVAVNLIVLFMIFKSPVDPQPDLRITHALMRIVPALRDKWFVILLVIYAGFWFMFAYNHTFLPVMMVEFARMPMWFTVPFLAVINPFTIVAFGPFLGRLVEKRKSLNVMMIGMVIFCVGFSMNGMSNTQFLFVAGIIIFSIGEFIVHPGFISYVSKIAPKDKVAIYLACIFLSTGLGQLVGGFVHGFWYNEYAYNQSRPQVYIAMVVSVGLLTLFAFMWYNRRQIAETLERDPAADVDKGIWTKPVTMVVALLFIPITIWGAFAAGPMDLVTGLPEEPDWTDWSKYDIVTDEAYSDTGNANENSDSNVRFSIEQINIRAVTFTLTWTDEPDASQRHNNLPDEFSLEVFAPDGSEDTTAVRSNPQGGMGTVSVTLNFDPDEDPCINATGEWIVTVRCHTCGDHVLWRPSGGFFDQPDNGNAWGLDVDVEYYTLPEQ